MATVTHASLSGSDLHEPKGLAPTALVVGDNTDEAYRIENSAGRVLLEIDTQTAGQIITISNTTDDIDIEFQGNSSAVFTINGYNDLDVTVANIDLDPTGTFTLDMDASQTATITVADNLASAFKIQEGSNTYFDVTTTDNAETVSLGNATTLPAFLFNGAEGPRLVSAPLQTTNVTATTIVSWTVANNSAGAAWVSVAAKENGAASRGTYFKHLSWEVDGAGAITLTSADIVTITEDEAAWDVTIDTATANTINVQCTGEAATTIDWSCMAMWHEAQN